MTAMVIIYCRAWGMDIEHDIGTPGIVDMSDVEKIHHELIETVGTYVAPYPGNEI